MWMPFVWFPDGSCTRVRHHPGSRGSRVWTVTACVTASTGHSAIVWRETSRTDTATWCPGLHWRARTTVSWSNRRFRGEGGSGSGYKKTPQVGFMKLRFFSWMTNIERFTRWIKKITILKYSARAAFWMIQGRLQQLCRLPGRSSKRWCVEWRSINLDPSTSDWGRTKCWWFPVLSCGLCNIGWYSRALQGFDNFVKHMEPIVATSLSQ